MATYNYKPPAGAKAPNGEVATSSEGKSRIYQLFESTIELDELSLPTGEPGPDTQKIENRAAVAYPLIRINDYMMNHDEILSMEIDTTGFIPKIILKCRFMHQTFLSKEMPKDGDIISVAIKNKSDVLKIIRNDYVITGVVTSETYTNFTGPTTITFYGGLYIPWISSDVLPFTHEGTTFETFKELAERVGLGFATNENNTDDKQCWIKASKDSLGEFIQRTIERSYRDGESFYDTWIDIYYNLNFINVNKQLMSAEANIDPAAWINNVDKELTFGSNSDQSEVIQTPKVLSNYTNYKATSFYISTWKPINKSTKVTFDVGTGINSNLFEHNTKLYANPDSKQDWKVKLEPVYDPEKVDKAILLRGRATQRPELRGTDQAKANYSYPELYLKNPWMGIQYTISNPNDTPDQWDGNHHRNYIIAKAQNTINNKELEKLNIEIAVNGLNMNIIRGDKTPVVLIQKDKVESNLVQPDAGDLDTLEQFYSGWYYVKGFKIKYNRVMEDTIMSNFSETFILTRREWPPPIPVDPTTTTQNENNV